MPGLAARMSAGAAPNVDWSQAHVVTTPVLNRRPQSAGEVVVVVGAAVAVVIVVVGPVVADGAPSV